MVDEPLSVNVTDGVAKYTHRMARKVNPGRERGHIRKRGNSYQVLVFAGYDPMTHKELLLSESTTDEREAKTILWRLRAQVEEWLTGQGARHGVYPFCGWCTDQTTPLPAPEKQSYNGIGTMFYGAATPCSWCGSVVKWLFFCVLWIPVWPMGRFRIIAGSRSLGSHGGCVGRRFPGRYDLLGKKTAALLTQEEAEAAKSRPKPPPSLLADHPELRGDRYWEAEDYWESGFVNRALPVYEEVLAAHEAVLPADDTATLQLRQRVAEAYLAVGRPAAALVLLTETSAHLARVLGPHHPDTRRARGDLLNARLQFGPSRDAEADAILTALAEVERTVGPDHPKALRMACTWASFQLSSHVVRAFDVLEETLDRAEQAFGTDHPETDHVRQEVIKACDFAEDRGKPAEVRAAVRARERVHGPDARETLASMRGLAQLYACSLMPGRRREAVELLQDTLERCERALGPDNPLTADVRRQLEELS